MTRARILALARKEWLDLRRNPGALVPVALVALLALLMPLLITFGIPLWTGESLADDSDCMHMSDMVGAPAEKLSAVGRVEYSLLQQFLVLFLLTPITGAMALAAHSVVGEKQARTLEPLLATPVTTLELLVAKVLGALADARDFTAAARVLRGHPGCPARGGGGHGERADAGAHPGRRSRRCAGRAAGRDPGVVAGERCAHGAAVRRLPHPSGHRAAVAQFLGAFWLSAGALVLVAVGLVVLWVLLVA